MSEPVFRFSEAVFCYLLTNSPSELFAKSIEFSKGLFLSYTQTTDVVVAQLEQRKVCVIGFCVDAHMEIPRAELAGQLLRRCGGIEELVEFARRLAGQYVLLYEDEHGLFAFGDATGRVQINYAKNPSELAISSNDKLLADLLGCAPSERALRIRMGSEFSQPFPNDLTLYDDIRVLLPNHYIELKSRSLRRFFPRAAVAAVSNNPEVIAESIRHSIELSRNILREYRKCYDVICPLSGGWDSRLNLAFAQEADAGVECYTFKHPGFTETTGDYFIPPRVCKDQHLPHRILPDLPIPEEYQRSLETVVGPYHSKYTLTLAYTLLHAYKGKAILDGGIIDQVGKSLLGNSLPDRYGTAAFFQAKLHNVAAETRQEIQRYLDALGSKQDVFDLFAIESRCGRWAAQGLMIYSAASIVTLNIFNCREIIELWMKVPRKLRVEKIIHKTAFETLNSSLLDVEFNPGCKTDVFKKHYLPFLAMTYAKQMIGYVKGKRRGLC